MGWACRCLIVGRFLFGLALPLEPHDRHGQLIQAFSAGAMLTMLADAMMPEAFEHGGKLVGIITVMGFLTSAILSGREV